MLFGRKFHYMKVLLPTLSLENMSLMERFTDEIQIQLLSYSMIERKISSFEDYTIRSSSNNWI